MEELILSWRSRWSCKMLHFVGRFSSLRMTLPQCHPFCNGFGKILQFCLGSNVATRPIDSFTNKKSFSVSWLKLARMSDLIMKTNKSLNKHRVQKINTTLWRRAGKNLGFYNFLRFFLGLFRFLSFFLDFNLQMPATKKLEPTSKDSVMRTPQIAIHNWISFCIKLVTQVKKKL